MVPLPGWNCCSLLKLMLVAPPHSAPGAESGSPSVPATADSGSAFFILTLALAFIFFMAFFFFFFFSFAATDDDAEGLWKCSPSATTSQPAASPLPFATTTLPGPTP